MPWFGTIFFKTMLVGALVITPLAVISTRIHQTSAAPIKSVCVLAIWKTDPSISSYHGPCPDDLGSTPVSNETATASPTSDPNSPTTDPTALAVSTTNPATTPTVEPSPTVSSETNNDSTASPTPNPAVSSTSDPTASVDPINEPTVSAVPTPVSTASATSSPTASATPQSSPSSSPTPTAEPAPAIPTENTDPKTKSFRFCHNGAMLSNSYNGMINGHHGNHPQDIIPPIPFKFYGGWNWNATNAKTFYNNCVPVS